MAFLIGGANSAADTSFEVANSCRFDKVDSAYLSRTFGTPTDQDKWTFSCWVKRGALGSNQDIFAVPTGTSGGYFHTGLQWNSSNQLEANVNYTGSVVGKKLPNALFRDISAWYHLVTIWDSDNGTAGNRIKLYINGVDQTSFATDTQPSSGLASQINQALAHRIGDGANGDLDGYLAEVVFVDGQALAPTSFGEYDEDSPSIWKPIDVSGLTFGNNGFYLDFEDSSALGNDVSGNNNDFAVTNLAATDQMTDSPTNNFPVINALFFGSGLGGNDSVSITRGNLVAHDYSGIFVPCTMFVNKGKWYWENKIGSQTDAKYTSMGIASESVVASNDMQDDGTAGGHSLFGGDDLAYSYYGNNGYSLDNDSTQAYGSTYAANDIIGVALDLDNNKLYFSKNGTWQNSGDPESGATGTGAISITNTYYTPMTGGFSGDSDNSNYNFGGGTTWAVSSANADANDGGTTFEYAPPSGYFAICTKNLAEYG
tara:strand:- start:98 stop:1549 length:1452 start_codon:yes stop_codon:yes gene_type:complete